MGILEMQARLRAKRIVIYQYPDKYLAVMHRGNEERVFELRFSPKEYFPDEVREILQEDNPHTVVELHV